jgi:hypothetical protein
MIRGAAARGVRATARTRGARVPGGAENAPEQELLDAPLTSEYC